MPPRKKGVKAKRFTFNFKLLEGIKENKMKPERLKGKRKDIEGYGHMFLKINVASAVELMKQMTFLWLKKPQACNNSRCHKGVWVVNDGMQVESLEGHCYRCTIDYVFEDVIKEK